VNPQEANESKLGARGDVITQKELASQLVFQNIEYPLRTSLLVRFRHGARIEPGPLTMVQPYFDFGPFIIPSSESTLRAERIRQCLHTARLALEEIDRRSSVSEFSQAAQEIRARVWETVLERRNASMQARNWGGLHARVRDSIYAWEVTWMLWAATKCVIYGFGWLGAEMLGIVSARASALALFNSPA
jgi:hypothetical protein